MSNIEYPMPHEYTYLSPFRFWCQKVLPLVYDDSLSYYELLCNVVEQLNDVSEDLNNMGIDIKTLYDFVNNYFKNLDVQEEINNKLDEMATDGTLDDLINVVKYNELDIKINALASGAPAGVYPSISSIPSSADKSRIYVVSDTGNWVYWNGSNWVNGGPYQSPVPTANYSTNLSTIKFYKGFFNKGFANKIRVDANGNVTGSGVLTLIGGENRVARVSENLHFDVNLPEHKNQFLYWDSLDNTIKICVDEMPENPSIVLGVFSYGSYYDLSMIDITKNIGKITDVDGKPNLYVKNDGTIVNKKQCYLVDTRHSSFIPISINLSFDVSSTNIQFLVVSNKTAKITLEPTAQDIIIGYWYNKYVSMLDTYRLGTIIREGELSYCVSMDGRLRVETASVMFDYSNNSYQTLPSISECVFKFDRAKPYSLQYLVYRGNAIEITNVINDNDVLIAYYTYGKLFDAKTNKNMTINYIGGYSYNDYSPIYLNNLFSENNFICRSGNIVGDYTYNATLSGLNITNEVVEVKSITKKILVIGDSLSVDGGYLRKLKELQPNLIFYGTSGDTVKYEGYGGANYAGISTTDKTDLSHNGAFNFSEYINKHPEFADVQIVLIMLGTNSSYDDVNKYLGGWIESIKEFNHYIDVINILEPLTGDQYGFGKFSNGFVKHWDNVKWDVFKCTYELNKNIIPAYYTLNRKYDFPYGEMQVDPLNPQTEIVNTNNVHPNNYGHEKIAYMVNAYLMKKY